MNLNMIGQAAGALLSGLNARDAKIEADKDKALQRNRQAIADNRATEQYNHDLSRQAIDDSRKDDEYQQNQQINQMKIDDVTAKNANTQNFVKHSAAIGANDAVGRDQAFADSANSQAASQGRVLTPSGKGDGVFTVTNPDGSTGDSMTIDGDAQQQKLYSLIDPTASYATKVSTAAETAKENRKLANDLAVAKAKADNAQDLARIQGGYGLGRAQITADGRRYAADEYGRTRENVARINNSDDGTDSGIDIFGNSLGGGSSSSTIQSGAVDRHGVPVSLVNGVLWSENRGGNPSTANPKTGATGNGQFLDSTVKMLKSKYGYTFDPTDPAQSRDAVGFYLSKLIQDNGGDVRKALAQYSGFIKKDPTSYINGVAANGDYQGDMQQQQSPKPTQRSWNVDAKVLSTMQDTIDTITSKDKDQTRNGEANGYLSAARSSLSKISTATTPAAKKAAADAAQQAAQKLAATLYGKTLTPEAIVNNGKGILSRLTGQDWDSVYGNIQSNQQVQTPESNNSKVKVVTNPLSSGKSTDAQQLSDKDQATINAALGIGGTGSKPTKNATNPNAASQQKPSNTPQKPAITPLSRDELTAMANYNIPFPDGSAKDQYISNARESQRQIGVAQRALASVSSDSATARILNKSIAEYQSAVVKNMNLAEQQDQKDLSAIQVARQKLAQARQGKTNDSSSTIPSLSLPSSTQPMTADARRDYAIASAKLNKI